MVIKLITMPVKLIKRIICITRSMFLSRLIDEGSGKFVVYGCNLKIKINKGNNSKVIINGIVKLESFLGGVSPIHIQIGDNAELRIDSDFNIGHGVSILINNDAKLLISGRCNESGSGITCDTKIMVNQKISIGKDFICSWDVFITDSDWHYIGGQKPTEEVIISDHVWIANNCSILKGTQIGSGCIVASHSKLCSKTFESDSLIGGVPAKVLKHPVCWEKDIIE